MYAYDSDSDSDSYEDASRRRSSSAAPATAAISSKPNVCMTVMSALMGNHYKSDSQRRLEAKQQEQEEREKVAKYISFNVPYVWVKKPMLLQESQLFHDAYPNPLFCLAVLGRLLRLHSRGELDLTQEEITDLFFGLTKLFGSSTIASPMDQYVRRMVYWLLNEITILSQPEERMMLLSCLTKDMTDRFTPALRARALRLLPCILIRQQEGLPSVKSNIQKLSQTIAATKTISTTLPCSLDPNNHTAVTARVMSGALVALTRLLQHEQSAQLISTDDEEPLQKQVYTLARAAATGTEQERDLSMVQFHALQTAIVLDCKQKEQYHTIIRMDEYDPSTRLTKLMGGVILVDSLLKWASPLTLVVLIRQAQHVLSKNDQATTNGSGKDQEHGTNNVVCATHYHFFLQSCLVNPSSMVVLEAARVVIALSPKHVPLDMMEKTVSVLNRIKKSSTVFKNKTEGRVAKRLLADVGQKLVQTL